MDQYQNGDQQRGGGFNPDALERKVFVGGISYDTTDADLRDYFAQFGEVKHAQVKFDPHTQRSRGFAFVEFADKETQKTVLANKDHSIKTKKVDVKKAVSRENKKIFVGGVSADCPEDTIKMYFSQYGEIEEVELPTDKNSGRRRNFCFVVFANEDGADKAARTNKHLVGDRWCDIKKATPNKPPPTNAAGYGAGGDYWSGGQGGPAPDYNNPAYNYYDAYQSWYNYYYGNYYGQAQAAAGQQQAQPAAAQDYWSQYYAQQGQQQQQQQQAQQQPGGQGGQQWNWG